MGSDRHGIGILLAQDETDAMYSKFFQSHQAVVSLAPLLLNCHQLNVAESTAFAKE